MSQEARWWFMVACGAVMLLGARLAMAGEAPWTAPAADRGIRNPLPRQVGMQEGKKVFELNCLLCHGEAGKGDGPVAAAMNPKPRDLTAKAVQSETDGELFWKITTGRGAMPPWQSLPEKERWSLVHYLRSLAGQKK